MTGSWNPTPEDLAAAVEAQSCSAVRRPIVKLGHVDTRFDGEPALGWFENLRLADGGATLVGDQVTLPWLHSVQAAAYPSRSVEGNYNHACGNGHRHKFVLTAVALLGVTPPAVKTIRNLNDLPAMLGVAAGEPEIPDGAEHVQVTILAGRHSFDEAKHARDGDGKFTSGAGGGEGRPAAVQAPALGLKRNEKLAARIPLAEGETYAGSAAMRSAGIALAAVDGPDGRSVRLGVGIDPDEINRWSGANRGSTIVLDQDGMNQLREAIPQMLEAGKQGKARWRQMEKTYDRLDAAGDQQALDAHNDAMTEFGDFSVLDEGVIAGGWGDLHLRVVMSSGEPRYEMQVQAEKSPPVVTDDLLEASHLRRLAKLLEQAGATKPVQASADPVQAAAEVHTGAMVALLPTADDAARLAVDGGEPADELHVTLAYLGDAADLDAEARQRIIAGVSNALSGFPQVEGQAFAVSAFNPPGIDAGDGKQRDTCITLGVGGDLVDTVHNAVGMSLDPDVTAMQHRPWCAHITLAYTDDLSKVAEWADRCGPVTFDRVRIALAGEHIEIPLIGADVAASADPTVLPAAEPEPETPEPKEDPVSTDLSALRSRLGLDDAADLDAITAAVDELKTKADTPPAPTEEMVAASQAATAAVAQAEAARIEMQTELQRLSGELATIKASAATGAKTALFDSAITAGKIKPAERESWEGRYDRAPEVITEILASIAPGTAVPVMASGTVGTPEPAGGESFDDAEYARLFGTTQEV